MIENITGGDNSQEMTKNLNKIKKEVGKVVDISLELKIISTSAFLSLTTRFSSATSFRFATSAMLFSFSFLVFSASSACSASASCELLEFDPSSSLMVDF